METKKTILMPITRAFMIRNLLRCGGLELFKKAGYRLVILFHVKEIPQYLKDELEDEGVVLVPALKYGVIIGSKFHKLANLITLSMIDTDSSRMKILFVNAKGRDNFYVHFRIFINKILNKIYFFKKIMRWIEFHVFPQKEKIIQECFDKYKPDIVFSTSIITHLDIACMKEARRRGISSVSMQKGWDNAIKEYYRFIPDYFLVQNENLIDIAEEFQGIPREKIYVIGFPQFDMYRKKEILRTREEHLKKFGLNSNLPVIFFGAEGVDTPEDYKIAEKIYEWIQNNELVKPCQLLVRPHFSNVQNDVFKNLRGKRNVAVHDYQVVQGLFGDKWNPTYEETVDFVNSVYHCNMMVNVASTLTLDAACVDRPIITMGFGCIFMNGRDVTEEYLYMPEHYKWVMDTGGVDKADSYEQLKDQINTYLLNFEYRSAGRERIRKEVCYKVDGKSSERMVNAIDDILSK